MRTMPSAPASWSSREPGTSERTWLRGVPWGKLGRVDVDALAARHDRVLLVAAHPDDEALTVGAFTSMLARAGLTIDVLLATDGEGSHSATTGLTPDVVRDVRRREFDEALAALLGDAVGRVVRLGLPDGGVASASGRLAAVFDEMLAGTRSALVIAPSSGDGHIDHDTCGRVAQDAARRSGAACVMYPLWWWHWGHPADVPPQAWDDVALVAPDVDSLDRKRDAIAAYASQTGTFARPAAEPAMLDAGVLAHFERLVETVFDPDGFLPRVEASDAGRTPAASFDAMFEGSDDPWGVETRWYERRRRALIEAMLPEEHLGRVLDLGCSTGALTQALAPRADAVVAVDASAQALRRARRRNIGHVEWRHAELPAVLDDLADEGQRFDTVVLSEIGYFLDGATLLATLAGIDRVLAGGGVVLVANWLHPTRDIPLDGRLVDAQVRLVWSTLARYEDDDVALVVARPSKDATDPERDSRTPLRNTSPSANPVPIGDFRPHSSADGDDAVSGENAGDDVEGDAS